MKLFSRPALLMRGIFASPLSRFLNESNDNLGHLSVQGAPLSKWIRRETNLDILNSTLVRAQSSGDAMRTLEIGRKICELNPSDDTFLKHAQQCLWANHITEAQQFFDKIESDDRKNAKDTLNLQVHLNAHKGDYDQALSALQIHEAPALLWFELAKVQLARGSFDQADATIRLGKETLKEAPLLQLLEVQLIGLTNGFDTAFAALNALTPKIPPKSEGWRAVYANLFMEHGRFLEALTYLTNALEENPDQFGLYPLHQAAAMQSDAGKIHNHLLEKVASRFPNHPQINVLRCNWAADQNDLDLAESLLPKIRIQSEWDYLTCRLGIACQSPGDAAAQRAFEACIKAGIKFGSVETLMANYLYYFQAAGGGVQQALKLIDPLIPHKFNDTGLLSLYLKLLLACERFEDAKAFFADLPEGLKETCSLKPFEMYFDAKIGNHERAKAGWQAFLTDSAHVCLNAHASYPDPIDLKYEEAPDDILLFLTVFNGIEYVDWFLSYYRQLGVNHFFITDNGSTDGTFERLRREDDVTLFQNLGSFSAAACGVFWVNYLMRRYGVGHWCFHVDMDEAFVFPRMEEGAQLSDLIAYLDANGFEAVPSLMLDIYPKHLGVPESNDRFSSSIYIDRDYFSMPCELPPYQFIQGGLRSRISGRSLMMTKSPLIKMSADTAYLVNNHQHTHLRMADMSAALLHYKFVGDLMGRVDEAIDREEHFMGARFYKSLRNPLSKGDASDGFVSEYSVIYEGPSQLCSLGLIHSSANWDKVKLNGI